MNTRDLSTYLARIGIEDRPAPTLAGLKQIHRAHLLSIPFENLDVQWGRPLDTSIPRAFDKIVNRCRGGWCYEMNGLFGWALSELGFRVTRLSGAVMRAVNGVAAEGNHLVLRVDLDDGPYFADVGFGTGPHQPFAVCEGKFTAHGFPYALSRADGEWWRMSELREATPFSYDVRVQPADETLLAEKCTWLQTAPQSPFTQNLVVQRHMPDGFAILRGRALSRVRPDGSEQRLLDNANDLVSVLKETFGLDVPEAATLWPKMVARHEELFGPAA